jgi:hypothetical protein
MAAHSDIGSRESRYPRVDHCFRAVVLALLYAAPAFICLHIGSVSDPDVWWHLRTGEWMFQHHSVPHIDSFSIFGAGKPWAAYSWLFEVLVYFLFHQFGLVGIVLYSAATVFAITVAVHHLVSRLQRDFSLSLVLTLVACYSLGRLFTPRPWLLTILFYVIELDILMHARRTGRTRELACLPVLFAVWANIHIQFVDGLILLALALGESVLSRWRADIPSRLHPSRVAVVCLTCLLATLINPYGWHLYGVAHDLVAEHGVFNKIIELQAMPFRDPADFAVLLLSLTSAAALAWSRCFRPFETALLAFGAIVSFRSQRDLWVVVIAAAVILASRLVLTRPESPPMPRFAALGSVGLAFILLLLGSWPTHLNNQHLERSLERDLPVRAIEVIRASKYPGPVYNDYGWGGYLIWRLRMPVSIDGRAALYGDPRIDRSDATWRGVKDWASDPDLRSARLVIAPAKAPLAQLLRLDPDFSLVFEDKLSAVFVSRKPH